MDLQVNFNGREIDIEEFNTIASATGSTIKSNSTRNVVFTGLTDWTAVETKLAELKTRIGPLYSKFRYSDGFMGDVDLLVEFNIQYNHF